MKILPLSTEDLSYILQSNADYETMQQLFHTLLESKNDWGNKWYQEEVKPSIKSLCKNCKDSNA